MHPKQTPLIYSSVAFHHISQIIREIDVRYRSNIRQRTIYYLLPKHDIMFIEHSLNLFGYRVRHILIYPEGLIYHFRAHEVVLLFAGLFADLRHI